jgi:repressor LexA
MQPRTKRQKEVLDFIKRYIERHGYEPSYQQIAWQLGVSSKAGIAKHVKSLEKQGLLTRRRDNGAFGLQIHSDISVEEAVVQIEWLDLPKNENGEDWESEPLFVPYFMIGSMSSDKLSAFRVRNDAMFDEQILEGDIAFIEKKPFPRDGEIVVAVIENKRVALKKFYRLGAEIELRPANDNYEPIMVSADKVEVLGVYRGLIRPMN